MMPLAGRWISRGHGRRVATAGAVVVGLGYLLASAAGSIQELVLAYDVVAGLGVGLAYGVPLAVVTSWFPERKGLAAGLTVTGFGLSPLITAPLAQGLIATLGSRPTRACSAWPSGQSCWSRPGCCGRGRWAPPLSPRPLPWQRSRPPWGPSMPSGGCG
jgi:MFS family permease